MNQTLKLVCSNCKEEICNRLQNDREPKFFIIQDEQGNRHVGISDSVLQNASTSIPAEGDKRKELRLHCRTCGTKFGSKFKKGIYRGKYFCLVDGKDTSVVDQNGSILTAVWKKNDEFIVNPQYCNNYNLSECVNKHCKLLHTTPKNTNKRAHTPKKTQEHAQIIEKTKTPVAHRTYAGRGYKSTSNQLQETQNNNQYKLERESRPIYCNAYNTPTGCRYGNNCKFVHRNINEIKTQEKQPPTEHETYTTRVNRHGFGRGYQKINISNENLNFRTTTTNRTQVERDSMNERQLQAYLRDLGEKEVSYDLAETIATEKFNKNVLNNSKIAEVKLAMWDQILRLYTHERFLGSIHDSKINTAFAMFVNSMLFRLFPSYVRATAEKKVIVMITKIFDEILRRCPNEVRILPISDLRNSWNRVMQTVDPDISLSEEIEILCRMQERIESGQQVRIITQEDEEVEEYHLHNEQILPSLQDVTSKIPKNLKPNRVGTKWGSVAQYLSCHFHLLRQDYIQPLRDGLDSYKSDNYRHNDLPVYTDVRILNIGISADKSNVKVDISFKTTRKFSEAKMLNLLKFGSLLCLTPSTGKKDYHGREEIVLDGMMIFAVVVEQNNGQIAIEPYREIDRDNLLENHNKVYMMLETPVFFKSVEPVLQAIRDTRHDDLPFQKELIEGEASEIPPKYIADNPVIDISSLLKDSTRRHNINVLKNWIPDDQTFLDPSQSKALCTILRNRLALIQGPPGTGKTFVGSQVTKLLAKYLNGRTIVVICYTNHALDQFLESVLDEIPNLVRIGGMSRSTNEKLLNRSLKKLKSKQNHEIKRIDYNIYETRRELQESWSRAKSETEQVVATYLPTILANIRSYLLPKDIPNTPRLTDKDAVQAWLHGEEVKKREDLREAALRRNKRRPGLIEVQNRFGALQAGEEGDLFEDADDLLTNLNESNFDAISQMMESRDHDELKNFAEDICEITAKDSSVAPMFAKLCASLVDNKKKGKEFHKVIPNVIQQCIENGKIPEIEKVVTQQDAQANQQQRRHRINNIVFIGELWKAGIVTHNVIHNTIREILSPEVPTESDVETVVNLLLVTGKSIDKGKSKKSMDEYFVKLEMLLQNGYSGNTKNMVVYLLELRHVHHWEAVIVLNVPEDPVAQPEAQDDEEIDLEIERLQIQDFEANFRELQQDMEVDSDDDEEDLNPRHYDMTKQERSLHEYVINVNKMFAREHPCNIPVNNRKEIVKKLQDHVRAASSDKLKTLIVEANQLLKRRAEIIEQSRLEVLRGTPLIGLTSTAASIHKQLLKKLKAPVYLIEEAAELLEAQVIACLHKDVQHLIMIGDEKQLRPKVSTMELERKYNFSISMFERLVKMDIQATTLCTQLRMRPEISKIMRLFYPALIDHNRVKLYPDVAGVGANVRFISHTHLENSGDESRSKTNDHEANYVTKLAKYLVNQPEYNEKDVTIITPYKGQLFLIKRTLVKMGLNGIRVVTVDDFQGEENKVVLVSLVRSNPSKKAGFVGIQNRIIVSLSRAQHGLYVIGNTKLLEETIDDWYRVLNHMEDYVSDYLPLCCPKHPTTVTKITNPRDFDAVVHGGCTRMLYICYY